MPEFLELYPPEQALSVLLDQFSGPVAGTEYVLTQNALNRYTAQAVISPEMLPAFPRSTVDGFAVQASDTYGASDTLPVYLEIVGEVRMGGAPDFGLIPQQTAIIYTGGMLPKGTDAIVMLENTQISRPGEVEILKSAAVGENIIKAGEDVFAGDEVMPAGKKIRPADIGGLLALGIVELEVRGKPRVGILSSGDEVVAPQVKPRPGQVRDINSYALSALVEKYGGQPKIFGVAPDDAQQLKKLLAQAVEESDFVVITAGSSASTRDYTAEAIQSIGQPGVLVHGVNVKPGKPTILAVCDNKPIIGLPGNPVSALVIAQLFVRPVLEKLNGLSKRFQAPTLQAELAVNLASQAGREDWVPVKLINKQTGWVAEPIFYKSNLIFTLARADGFIRIQPDATGIGVGEQVNVILMD
jgi:molybdopterin molybdotransferase